MTLDVIPKALYKVIGFDEWQTTSPSRLVKWYSIILFLNCTSSGLNSEIQIPKNNTQTWIFFRECWVILQFVSAREGHTSVQSGGRTDRRVKTLELGVWGWHLFESHYREWQVILGLNNSTHNRTRAEMAFVWEVIQKTAVLFVYSSRLVSMAGVYASQNLAKDIIWGLRRKY